MTTQLKAIGADTLTDTAIRVYNKHGRYLGTAYTKTPEQKQAILDTQEMTAARGIHAIELLGKAECARLRIANDTIVLVEG